MGTLASIDTTNIGMLPSASKYVSVDFAYQCLHILNNKERLNGLKGSTKMQTRQSRFKYQSRIYNVQRKYDVDHKGMKIIWNNKLFPSLNALNGKTFPYTRNVIIIHYHYWSGPKIGPGIFAIIIIPCICHSCTDILSIS